jgi:hypothetical protein
MDVLIIVWYYYVMTDSLKEIMLCLGVCVWVQKQMLRVLIIG